MIGNIVKRIHNKRKQGKKSTNKAFKKSSPTKIQAKQSTANKKVKEQSSIFKAIKEAVSKGIKGTKGGSKKSKSAVKKVGDKLKNGILKTGQSIKEGVADIFSPSRAKIFKVGQTFKFPEENIPSLKNRASLGIAFSGGGTRSASATLGQIRGLKKIGLLKDVKYISCVSGGAWTAAPFTYLGNKFNEDRFLGAYVEPNKIKAKSGSVTSEAIEPMDKKSHAYTISESPILLRSLKHVSKEWLSGREVDESFSRAVGEIFLKPYDLHDPKKFFTWDQTHVRDMMKRNPHLSEKEFYKVERDRPYLIGAGTVHQGALKMYHMEYTPLYVGVSQLHKGVGKNKRDIGGGYIEPIGFDSYAPKTEENRANAVDVRLGRKFHRFSLADSIGSNGSAPTIVVRMLRPIVESLRKKAISPQAKILLKGFEILLKGFPNFRYWPLTKIAKTKEEKYDFGDAGVLDSLGIMPLLKRKVKNIVVFVNTNEDFGLFKNKVGHDRLAKGSRYDSKTKDKLRIDPDLSVLFGKEVKGFTIAKLLQEKNKVFADADKKYAQLVNGLLEAQEQGRGLVYKDNYQIRANNFYGISAYEANILWVYNHEIPEWKNKLDKKVKEKLPADFPCYKTFLSNTNLKDMSKNARRRVAQLKEASFEPWQALRKELTKTSAQKKAEIKRFLDNCPAIIDLSPEHVELLAHMHAYNVVENKTLFKSMAKK